MKALTLSASVAERLLRSEYRVAITGASGWLGRACIEILLGVFHGGFAERVKCFGSSARTLRLRFGQSVEQLPLSALQAMDNHPTVLLHFAYLTKDKIADISLDQYVATNRYLSLTTVDAARRIGVTRVFLASSGAVYQALAALQNGQEAEPYGFLKLEEEALFERFAHERGGRKVVIARLFNLSGPYINKLSSYALSSFIEQAWQRSPRASIRINAAHAVVRSYIGVENLISVALSQLLSSVDDTYHCFDTAGEKEVELQELAEAVATIVNPDAVTLRPPFTSGHTDRYVGDGAKYCSMALLHGVRLDKLAQQVRDTADYLGEVLLRPELAG